MFARGALKRRGTRVLMSFMAHLVYEEIADIVSGSVIDTLGLMAHYAVAYVSLHCWQGRSDYTLHFIRQSFFVV